MNDFYVKGRKRKIATASNAVGDGLAIFSALLKDKTIKERRDWMMQNTVGMYDEIKVLNTYIDLGYGDEKYSFTVHDAVPKNGRRVKDLIKV